MLENRSFIVKVVKDVGPPKVGQSNEVFDINALVRTITKGTICVIAVYMGSDALRKILVHVVASKIH